MTYPSYSQFRTDYILALSELANIRNCCHDRPHIVDKIGHGEKVPLLFSLQAVGEVKRLG
jgi:hypothetical protein